MNKKDFFLNRRQAKEIAEKNIYMFLIADYGKRLVSDYEDPLDAYIQGQNSWSQAGEVFSVRCPGIGNLDMSYYREGWDNDYLSDEEVIWECCNDGDMTDEIDDLADSIYKSNRSL